MPEQSDLDQLLAMAASKAREALTAADSLKLIVFDRTQNAHGRPLSEREEDMIECSVDAVHVRIEALYAILRPIE